MNHLRNGDFISSLIVNYILKKTINNKNIYVFETLEPSFISKINDQTILEMFQEATLYPVWICPVCDNNHFTLFIVHTVHLNSSFQQSCILFFNSLPSFSFDMKNHVDMLKELLILSIVNMKTKFTRSMFLTNQQMIVGVVFVILLRDTQITCLVQLMKQ